MARLGVAALSLVLVLLGAGVPRPAAAAAAKTQVFLSKLPKALVVGVSPKHGEVMYAGENTVTVTWSLNTTEPAGADAAFKSVKVKLCYAPASRTDRGWRKASDDLHKDKACQFKVTVQPYAAGKFDYVVARDIPTASYFVRAYAVDASGTEVAYGQSSPDAAFDVVGITGIHASLKVTAGVFSTFSIAALAFFFVVEKRKKDK